MSEGYRVAPVDEVASAPPVTPHEAAESPRALTAPRWHLGWALGVAAAGSALVAGVGEVASATIGALALAAAPGVLGYVWQPKGAGRIVLLVLWALAVAVAALLQGGVTGPIAVWAVAPLLAGACISAAPEGAVAAAVALAVTVLGHFAGLRLAGPEGAFGAGLAAAAVLMLGAAAAGAFVVFARRSRRREAEIMALLQVSRARALPAPAASGAPSEDALAEERVRREAAEARVRALEHKLKTTELARSRAFAVASDAQAARAEAEAARAEAEGAAAAKSRFLANMSHELRTPLNAIMGFSDIMRAKMFGELPGKYAEYAQLIHESGRHLTDLINDVLDMSKIEAERYTLSREVFDAREAVNAALRLVRLQADEAGIQLRGVLPQGAMTVDADRRAIKQIVLNLVSNALKFTPRGGSVTVTLAAVENALELVVADTGVGIAKEDLERLGRPFEQAGDAGQRVKGTGLGLSLVRAFARLHGGEMSIESALGEGAAVTVRLPVLEVDEPAPSPERGPHRRGEDNMGGPQAAPPQEPTAPRGAEVIPLNRLR